MPPKDTNLPRFALWIVTTQGANRVRVYGADTLSEAFDKDSSPPRRSICALVDVTSEFEDAPVLYGFAVTQSRAGVAAGTVRAMLSPVHLLNQPVTLTDLVTQGVQVGEAPPPFFARSASRSTAVHLIDVLEKRGENLKPWLNGALAIAKRYAPSVEQARAEARDAVVLAAQIAKLELPADTFIVAHRETSDDTLLDTVLNRAYERDLEEELLPLDLGRFDGKLTPNPRSASTTVFEDRGGKKRLVVMSVNKKPLEEELGIDLLYWDRVHDSFTFVQYKRLEREESRRADALNDWTYRRKGELVKQLNLMPAGIEKATTAEDWRAFGTPFWFKFVRGDAAAKLDEKSLKGMHVPAEWLRLAIAGDDLNSGPRGGFRVTYNNTKYIGRTTFAEIVSRGLTGTGGGRTEAFKKVIADLGVDRELIVAIREDWGNDQSEPQDNGAESPAGEDQDRKGDDSPF